VTPIAGEATEEQALPIPESERAVLGDADDATALKQPRELFEQGNDRQAIAALYDAALALLVRAIHSRTGSTGRGRSRGSGDALAVAHVDGCSCAHSRWRQIAH
jgi:hypothetical protein